jgi:hypothetical protein
VSGAALDWAEFYRELIKNTEWPPHVLFSMHPAFWHGIANAGSGKVKFSTFEELEWYVNNVLPADTEEARLKEARKALRFELDWYDH